MNAIIDVQIATAATDELPDTDQIIRWAQSALTQRDTAEVTVRIVDAAEISRLNETYRKKSGATNVLSFPADVPAIAELSLLGDVVICASVVIAEAHSQGKSPDAHWAHMIIHGILHLQGFSHENAAEAAAMEGLEVDILARLGYSNPYQAGQTAAKTRGSTLPQ